MSTNPKSIQCYAENIPNFTFFNWGTSTCTFGLCRYGEKQEKWVGDFVDSGFTGTDYRPKGYLGYGIRSHHRPEGWRQKGKCSVYSVQEFQTGRSIAFHTWELLYSHFSNPMNNDCFAKYIPAHFTCTPTQLDPAPTPLSLSFSTPDVLSLSLLLMCCVFPLISS